MPSYSSTVIFEHSFIQEAVSFLFLSKRVKVERMMGMDGMNLFLRLLMMMIQTREMPVAHSR